MYISVVIPSRNSAPTIGRTLEALLTAERKPDEILVVDGQSSDQTASIARSYSAQVVINNRLHTAAARQLGTERATYNIIAFTDSDCIPEHDWLRRIAEHFESDAHLAGVGGRIVLKQPRNRIEEFSARVFEEIKQFPTSPMKITQKKMRGSIAGANCAFRKSAILSIGGFRDEFANTAEEVDLLWRLLDEGAKLVFDPFLIVEHLGYPDALGKLIRRNFSYGITSTRVAKYHLGTPRVDWYLYRKLLSKLVEIVNPLRRDDFTFLYCVQISSFIAGKVYGSMLERSINL